MQILLISPELFVSDKIALIGSSGLLKEKGYGKLIDSFDDVVRFNRAPTEGYEESVGEKTTIRVVNNHVFNNNKLDEKKWSGQPKNFVRDLRNTKVVYFSHDMGPWANRKKNTHESCDLFRFQYEYMGELKKIFDYRGKPFTIGIGFILCCVSSGIKPWLFGFDLDLRERDHYWEKCPPSSGCHERSAEQQLLKELLQEKRIVVK